MAVDVDVVEVQTTVVVEATPLPTTIEIVIEQGDVIAYEIQSTQVVEAPTVVEFIEIEVGIPGPPGPPGPGAGETVPYAKRTDFVGDTLIYKGEAAPGSLETAPVWRISRLTFVGDDVSEQWADTAAFTQVWTNRLALTYI